MDYKPECGDIFLSDGTSTGAKIVKFLMQEPTVWAWIYHWVKGDLPAVPYYHVGMVFDDMRIVEQQSKVQGAFIDKILPRKIVIYRYKGLTDKQKFTLQDEAMKDMGMGYGIPLCIGKFFTWLTGIIWFEDFFGRISKNLQICDNRVVKWMWLANVDHFGLNYYGEATTQLLNNYCAASDKWEIVYEHN